MTRPTADQKRHAQARQRRRLPAHERLERDQRQAQRAAEALPHPLEALGLPADLGVESAGRFHSQPTLLGKMVGVRFPALCGCRTPSALWRVRGWETHWPARLLGALPTRAWLKRRRRVGLEVGEPGWRHGHDTSPATQRRWQWTWVWDDAGFHTYGAQVGERPAQARVGGPGWAGAAGGRGRGARERAGGWCHATA